MNKENRLEAKRSTLGLGHLLIKASQNPQKLVHLIHRGTKSSYTYSEISFRANQIADHLKLKGIKRGDTAIIILPTSISFYDSFFGITLAGATPCALYPPVRLTRLEEWQTTTLEHIGELDAKFVLTLSQIESILRPKIKEEKFTFILMDHQKISTESESESDPQFSPDLLVENENAFIQLSSGTTGKSKSIAITHKNVIKNMEAIVDQFPIPINEMSCVSWLPLYHDMGLVGTFLSALYVERPLTLIPPEEFIANPILWPKILSETKSTVTVAPNFAFGLLNDRLKYQNLSEEKIDLSSLKIILCGAEPIHPDTLNQFQKLFLDFNLSETAMTPVYGMAEASLAITFSSVKEKFKVIYFDKNKMDYEKKAIPTSADSVLTHSTPLVCLGKPIKGIELEIWDEQNRSIGPGEIGEVVIKGESVSFDQLQKKGIRGFLKTGDFGFLYQEELYLTGRIKDLIIINGKNYDPYYFEQKAFNIKGLRNGIAIAFGHYNPTKHTEEVILLCEYRNKKIVSNTTKILGEINQKINPKIARLEILPPGTLLRTSSGKLKRGKTKELWMLGKLKPPRKFLITKLLIISKLLHNNFRRRWENRSL